MYTLYIEEEKNNIKVINFKSLLEVENIIKNYIKVIIKDNYSSFEKYLKENKILSPSFVDYNRFICKSKKDCYIKKPEIYYEDCENPRMWVDINKIFSKMF